MSSNLNVPFAGDALLVLINFDSTFAHKFTRKVGVVFNLIVRVRLNVRIRIPTPNSLFTYIKARLWLM